MQITKSTKPSKTTWTMRKPIESMEFAFSHKFWARHLRFSLFIALVAWKLYADRVSCLGRAKKFLFFHPEKHHFWLPRYSALCDMLFAFECKWVRNFNALGLIVEHQCAHHKHEEFHDGKESLDWNTHTRPTCIWCMPNAHRNQWKREMVGLILPHAINTRRILWIDETCTMCTWNIHLRGKWKFTHELPNAHSLSMVFAQRSSVPSLSSQCWETHTDRSRQQQIFSLFPIPWNLICFPRVMEILFFFFFKLQRIDDFKSSWEKVAFLSNEWNGSWDSTVGEAKVFTFLRMRMWNQNEYIFPLKSSRIYVDDTIVILNLN